MSDDDITIRVKSLEYKTERHANILEQGNTRMNNLDTRIEKHVKLFEDGVNRMNNMHLLIEQQMELAKQNAAYQVTNSKMINRNSEMINQLSIDTAEIISIHSTAKSVRKFLVYWVAPCIAGFYYLKDHWKDLF